MFSDRTGVYFDAAVSLDGPTVVIDGATDHPVLLATLEQALRLAGVSDVGTRLRLLPEQGRMGADGWFGRMCGTDGVDVRAVVGVGTDADPVALRRTGVPAGREKGFYLMLAGMAIGAGFAKTPSCRCGGRSSRHTCRRRRR